jgi:PAS domain S-box-containing protein
MTPNDPLRPATFFECECHFGIIPNFFYSASAAPALIDKLWAFYKSSFIDSPLPSLFKERLAVHLSRLCEVRYCIVRHVGFLIGEGRPAGDPEAEPQTIEQVITLLRRPLPDEKALAEVFARLESYQEPRGIPEPGTQSEYDLFDALTVMFLEPLRWERARDAVRRAVGDATFEVLAAFLAFVRILHFWTETHPEIAIDNDMVAVLETNGELARLLLDPSEAERAKAGEALHHTLARLEDVEASLRVSSQTLELALQSAGQFAWEIDRDTRKLKVIGDPALAFGFNLLGTEEERFGLVHSDDKHRVREGYEAMLTGGGPYEIDHRLVNPSTGETLWAHWTGRLVHEKGRTKLVGITRNVTARKNAELALRDSEKRLRVLVAELQHRTRNLISVISATVENTLRVSKTFDDFKASFRDRIGALGRVQGLLSRVNMKENDRVTFDELVETELTAQSIRVGRGGPVSLDGPRGVPLRSRTVQTFALVLHELATNAIKYGALKQPNGHLAIRWRLERMGKDRDLCLNLDWKESGVKMPPEGVKPQGTGQGRELIEQALPYQFNAQTTFAMEPDGVHCTIALPVSGQMTASDPSRSQLTTSR